MVIITTNDEAYVKVLSIFEKPTFEKIHLIFIKSDKYY